MTQPQQSREERLAAKLRENLRRRKAQARAFDVAAQGAGDETAESESVGGAAGENDAANGRENESGALSKSPPES